MKILSLAIVVSSIYLNKFFNKYNNSLEYNTYRWGSQKIDFCFCTPRILRSTVYAVESPPSAYLLLQIIEMYILTLIYSST